jgi:hypothetical protein
MPEAMTRDTCDVCGGELDDGSHFAIGKTWCAACWSGQRPPVAMPPTARQLDIIRDWIRPRLPQRQGVQRGQDGPVARVEGTFDPSNVPGHSETVNAVCAHTGEAPLDAGSETSD